MSRAFVKEMDDLVDDDLPERPQSPHPNYVTPTGLARLEERVAALSLSRQNLLDRDDLMSRQQLKAVERDLRYYTERVKRALLVEVGTQPDDRVHFGACVEVEDSAGERQRFTIVGEDEADVAQGKISWVSPLARALLNAALGDLVVWKRPAGDLDLEITAIRKN